MAIIYNLIRRPDATNGLPANSAWKEYDDFRLATTRNHEMNGNYSPYGDSIEGLMVGAKSKNKQVWTDIAGLDEGDLVDLWIETGSPLDDMADMSLAVSIGTTMAPKTALETIQAQPGEITRVTLTVPVEAAAYGHRLVLWAEGRDHQQAYYPVAKVRLSPFTGDDDDGLGIFDGDTPDRDDATFEWTGTAHNSPSKATVVAAPIEVTALPPTWTDNTGQAGGGMWTTPSIEGVIYEPATGNATSGQTVTVTATALEGYVIVGDSEWTHTFPEATPDPEDPEPEDPEPEDPDPEDPADIAATVATLLGIERADTELYAVVTSAVEIVAMMAYGYTRGNGFQTVAGKPTTRRPELVAVITSASSRLAANPSGLRYRAGTETVSDVFSGWTLAERYVLDGYRKKWA